MEYSMKAVSQKMILVIVILTVLIAIGGGVFYFVNDNFLGIIPFAAGAALAMLANIAKVLLLKRTVEIAVDKEEASAKLYMQGQYFIRLLLTAGVFLLAVFIPDSIVNFMGTVIAIFTLPIATYSVKFFLKDQYTEASLKTKS